MRIRRRRSRASTATGDRPPSSTPAPRCRARLRRRATRSNEHSRRRRTRLVVKVGSSLVTNEAGSRPRGGRPLGRRRSPQLTHARQRGGARFVGRDRRGHASGSAGRRGRARCTSCRRPPRSARWASCRRTSRRSRKFGLHTAQILLTHEDLADRRRYLNARSTLARCSALGVIPIINENDTVTTDEIRFGDNDTLGALVDQPDRGRRARAAHRPAGPVHRRPAHGTRRRRSCATARAGDPALEAMAGGAGSALGRGGMLTKVLAAKRAARSGASTVIA